MAGRQVLLLMVPQRVQLLVRAWVRMCRRCLATRCRSCQHGYITATPLGSSGVLALQLAGMLLLLLLLG